MTPSVFKAQAKRLLPGRSNWRAILARLLGVDHHTITRRASGKRPIDKETQWAMYGLEMCKRNEPQLWEEMTK